MFYKANSEKILIKEGSPFALKPIRDLNMRTKTGATIVGLERGGENLVNPDPDERLQIGDKVLVLGSIAQLAAARALLTSG